MTEDLEMTGDDYNVALFTFFITYILFEVRLSLRIIWTSRWPHYFCHPSSAHGNNLLAIDTPCLFTIAK